MIFLKFFNSDIFSKPSKKESLSFFVILQIKIKWKVISQSTIRVIV